MSKVEKVYIIGIGEDGLEGVTASAKELIARADSIVGVEKTLAMLAPSDSERIVVGNDLSVVLDHVTGSTNRKIVVLATGDPLFYGVARFLCDRLGKERFEVVPHVSSMQLAFARIKESWEEAYLTDLTNRNLEYVVERIRTAEKAGLFTTEDCPPAVVAQALLDRKIDYFTAYVCENLGSPDERVTHAELADLVDQEFSPLNVMIFIRMPDVPDRPVDMVGRRLFGNEDEMFLHSQPKRDLLTPAEVRAIALAQMDLGPTSTVWDVGAGSGSMAVEAAQLASGGTTYAIEMDPEDYSMIMANAERFGVKNVVPVLGEAPEAWNDLPDPDAVFVGGAGRGVSRLADLAYERLRPGGRMVANVGSIDNLVAVQQVLQHKQPDTRVWMINVAHGTYQMERIRFESMNPTFVIAVVKNK